MKIIRVACKSVSVALICLIVMAGSVWAQDGTNRPVGQEPGQAINQLHYLANTDTVGFSDQSATTTPLLGVGTTQATAAQVMTRVAYVSCATGATAIILPAVTRYTSITLINRGTASCLVFPTVGAQLETAPGTLAAANASFTMAINTDVTFRPLVISGVTEWMQ